MKQADILFLQDRRQGGGKNGTMQDERNEHVVQKGEGNAVEDGADRTEQQHEFAQMFSRPVFRIGNIFFIDRIPRQDNTKGVIK